MFFQIKNYKKFPVTQIIQFTLENGKYLTSNGLEVTTEMLSKHEHSIENDRGYASGYIKLK